MPWLQIKFDTQPDEVDTLSDLLEEFGALSVSLEDGADQALLEPAPGEQPLWQHTRVIGLFSDDTSAEDIIAQLKTRIAPKPLPPHQSEILQDQAWERAWMDDFKPICFGERLWICPSWCEPPQENAVNIKLDPGLAFGTGTHPTTALCLRWLDAHAPQDLDVIDFGCGSGILAVAAAMLGARQLWAIDHDPQAILATKENAQNNGVEHLIIAGKANVTPKQAVDLILANILAQPLIELAPTFAQLTKPGGRIVLSGILDQQVDGIIATYQHDFILDPPILEEEWALISGSRKT